MLPLPLLRQKWPDLPRRLILRRWGCGTVMRGKSPG